MKGFDSARINVLRERFNRLYQEIGHHCFERMQMTVGRYGVGVDIKRPAALWTEKDAILITYGDMLRSPDATPLATLHGFLTKNLRDAFNTVHILPFFPSSSDDGFAVVDYHEVSHDLGAWEDIEALGKEFHLMVDLVLNHVSRQSHWFKDYTAGVSPARFYFIEADPQSDLSSVVRPRVTPLLTPTQTRNGERHVWTTFSDDQIDLNFANPDVLFEFIDILFFYISKGARVIRLDAIAYLWKQLDTRCIHLPQTHEIVKLFRNIVDLLAPGVLLITETNVPHKENLSYFGTGDEAHMVYQFTLSPLLLHALQTGQSAHLTAWAASLPALPPGRTFLNFTASHDGIGVRPLEGILTTKEIAEFGKGIEKRGGHVSTKLNADGSESPYELNTTYFDALADPEQANDPRHIDRFLCSQTIPLALRGIPAVYFNNLIGAPNDHAGVKQGGRARLINRRKWELAELDAELAVKTIIAARVFRKYVSLLALRARHPAFHPDGRQQVLRLGNNVFAVERTAPDGSEIIVAISNLTNRRVQVKLDDRIPALAAAEKILDLLRKRNGIAGARAISLAPYKTAWLTPSPR